MGRKRYVAILLLLLVIVLFACLPASSAVWRDVRRACGLGTFSDAADDAPFALHVLDVGKADSLLLECGGEAMLVDGGTPDRGEEVVQYLTRRGIDSLRYVVNTHPDADHIGGLPDFSALKFTRYNQYESLILPMQRYLENAGVDFRFNTEVTNVLFEHRGGRKIATAIECRENGVEKGILLTEKDLVFVTNGSCTEGTIYGDQHHAPNGDAEVKTSGCWNLWKNIAKQDPAFGRPEKFCSDIAKTNWESATVTTLDDKIIPYITNICKRDPRSGKVVTGGIVSCQDSSWLLSWTINRQGQFKEQNPEQVCVWVYGLFTDVPGDFVKKPMKDCTGMEITQEWLYHIGVPVEQIPELAENSAVCVPTMMPYITAFFMPRTEGDRPDVIPDGCVNFAFLGQFAQTPRDTVFTTEYSVRTAMEAVYGLLGVDRGVPEVWGSVYDIRDLLDASVKLMDGKSPLDIELPGPLTALKKPLLHFLHGTVVEKLLEDHGILRRE